MKKLWNWVLDYIQDYLNRKPNPVQVKAAYTDYITKNYIVNGTVKH